MKNDLTVVVLTRNEEENIVDCLESVSFANEILIIDDNSDDRTIELAKQFTTNIHIHSLNGNFASQRNYALNFVHCSWVLFIDADERVSNELKVEILRKIEKSNVEGFFVKRVDTIWGHEINYGEGGNIKLLRLAKKGSGKWKGKVHEQWRVLGDKEILENPLMHIPHSSVSKFIADIDEYSSLRAAELYENNTKVSAFQIFMLPFGKFILNYFIKKGYKDGIPGFLYAMIMSIHSFLVRAKIYLLQKSSNAKL